MGSKTTGKIPPFPKYRLHGWVEQLGTCVQSPREVECVHLFLLLAVYPSPIPGAEGRGKGLFLVPPQVGPPVGRSAGTCMLYCGPSQPVASCGGQVLGEYLPWPSVSRGHVSA